MGTRISSAICLPVSLLFSSSFGNGGGNVANRECELAMKLDEFDDSTCCGWFSSVSVSVTVLY